MVTPRLQLDTVEQTYSTAAVNLRILNRLEVAAQMRLQSVSISAVPSSPQPGQTWWLPPTVDWSNTVFAGRGNQFATWWFGWQFMLPYPGQLAYIVSEQRLAAYQASRTWTSTATVSHYSYRFDGADTNFLTAYKPLFYTERGVEIVQARGGINYTGSGTYTFGLHYYQNLVVGGPTPTAVDIIPGGLTTVSDINQGHTISVISTVPANSWIYLRPDSKTGTVNWVHLELMMTELL